METAVIGMIAVYSSTEAQMLYKTVQPVGGELADSQ